MTYSSKAHEGMFQDLSQYDSLKGLHPEQALEEIQGLVREVAAPALHHLGQTVFRDHAEALADGRCQLDQRMPRQHHEEDDAQRPQVAQQRIEVLLVIALSAARQHLCEEQCIKCVPNTQNKREKIKKVSKQIYLGRCSASCRKGAVGGWGRSSWGPAPRAAAAATELSADSARTFRSR